MEIEREMAEAHMRDLERMSEQERENKNSESPEATQLVTEVRPVMYIDSCMLAVTSSAKIIFDFFNRWILMNNHNNTNRNRYTCNNNKL